MGATSKANSLTGFAKQLSEAAHTVSAWCAEHAWPEAQLYPTDADKETNVLPKGAPLDVQVARQDVVDAAKRILQLSTEPDQFLPELAVHAQTIACIQWICRFDLPNHVPATSSISYDELAHAAKVPVTILKSIVRMGICAGFFEERTAGQVSHSRLSAHFATSAAMRKWTEFLASATVPMALRFADATQKWPDSTSQSETAFNIALDTDLPFFDYLNTHQSFREEFAAYMKCVTSTNGTATEHLVNGFDWACLGKAVVVDIGGSSGHASITLAHAFDQLQFVVQDLPEVIETSQKQASSMPSHLQSRVTFQGYNFFDEQPVKDADVYLLRMILHDWPDREAKKILENVCAAMKPGARLIIMDTALPAPGTVSLSQESQLRVRGLTMRQTFNAYEREMEEWAKLLGEVSSKWQIKRSVSPFGSNLSVLEVGFV